MFFHFRDKDWTLPFVEMFLAIVTHPIVGLFVYVTEQSLNLDLV